MGLLKDQVSSFFPSVLDFLTYEMVLVTSVVNYFEICGESCDRMPSILIMVVDIAITTRRI